MKKFITILASLVMPLMLFAQKSKSYTGPIIDMHLHSYDEISKPRPNPATGQISVESADEHMKRCVDLMKQYNIVLAAVSGSMTSVDQWYSYAPDRVLKGIGGGDPAKYMDIEKFRTIVKERKVAILGEVGAQYEGYSPSDPAFDPYWAIAEQYGIPVAIHTGGSFPGIMYTGYPKFRLRFGDPLLLEDMLVKFPKLKVYIMHAGGLYFGRNAISLMVMYPHVYADIGVLTWLTLPEASKTLESFLREAKKRNLLNRVMFGTDQMFWPEAIEMAIKRVNLYDFLTLEEKRGIFYDNAARFLGLSEEDKTRHHQNQNGSIK